MRFKGVNWGKRFVLQGEAANGKTVAMIKEHEKHGQETEMWSYKHLIVLPCGYPILAIYLQCHYWKWNLVFTWWLWKVVGHRYCCYNPTGVNTDCVAPLGRAHLDVTPAVNKPQHISVPLFWSKTVVRDKLDRTAGLRLLGLLLGTRLTVKAGSTI